MKILCTRWIHKSAILKTIILEFLLISLRNIKCFQHFIIFEFQTCLCGPILHNTQHLQIKHWLLDKTAISTNVFIIDFSFTNITFILYLYEVNIDNKPTNLNNMTNNIVTWDSLQQLYRIIGCKIINFFIYFADYFKIHWKQLQLHIYIQIIGYFPESISYQNHLILEHKILQFYRWVMLNKKAYFGFIINGFHVDLWGH